MLTQVQDSCYDHLLASYIDLVLQENGYNSMVQANQYHTLPILQHSLFLPKKEMIF